MSHIKLRVEKCADHNHWLVKHDGHVLDFAATQPEATAHTAYWIHSFKEYRP